MHKTQLYRSVLPIFGTMNQLSNFYKLLLILLICIGATDSSIAQNVDSKRFVITGVSNHQEIQLIDSVIRQLDGVHLLRVDFNTRNCVGLFEQSQNYNKVFFKSLLTSYGFGLKCYSSVFSSSQLLPPIPDGYCREPAEPEVLSPERLNGPCCTEHGNIGCFNLGCQTAICTIDPFCCTNSWDSVCASEAITNANGGGACAGVSDCPVSGSSGVCCTANGTPGCENAACQAAICAIDNFCCVTSWDALCADYAFTNAEAGGPCANVSNCPPPAGNNGGCCTSGGNGSVGCDNAACEAAICAIDPFCCNNVWDGVCADDAIANALAGGACSGISDCPTGGGGGPVTAGDCVNAINVCTDLSFSINPSGYGSINEIAPPGSISNPLYGDLFEPFMPWGSNNFGCLRNGELNSTWMIINIQTGGVLEFTFGGLGTQAGFYDWIMYSYDSNTCTDILNNSIAPIRCNWNSSASGGTGLATTLPPGGMAGNFEPPINVAAGDQYVICFSNWSDAVTDVPLQFGGTADVSCTPLPVELLSFTGKEHHGDVKLDWSTSSETNNDFFSLERSYDGTSWETIATISGAGNSSHPINYEHIDKNPASGTIYYRLFQQDFDGSVKPVGEVAVSIYGSGWTVFPNPSNHDWNIHLPGSSDGYHIELRNARGQIVDFEQVTMNRQMTIKLKHHLPGVFLLRVFDAYENEAFSTRLVAQ